MKTICYLAILTAGLWGMENSVLAQGTPPTPNFVNLPSTPSAGPQIKFEKMIWDFGKVIGGETVTAEFVFTNTGDKTLEIPEVRPGCGCTVAGEWTRKVEPGKTGIVPLKLNTSSLNGQTVKTATVGCNDPNNKQLLLQLKADVWRAIQVAPQLAMIQLSSEAPSNAAVVKIINNVDTALTLSDIRSMNPAFGAEVKTVKEGKEYELVVYTVPPFPTNTVQGQITVKSSSTNMPVISVVAYANYQPVMQVLPASITLPMAPLPNPITMSVYVRNNSSNEVQVTSTSVNVIGAEVKLTPFNQNRYINVAVTFPAGTSLNSTDNPEVTIKTTHPSYPVLKVPILQSQPGKSVSAAGH